MTKRAAGLAEARFGSAEARVGKVKLDSPAVPGSSQHKHHPAQSGGGLLRELVVGFAFWLAFLLLLEPGNVVAVARSDVPLSWSQEAARILGASLLGALATPLLFTLTRRLPIEGPRWWRRAAIHALGIVTMAAGLIVVARGLAAVVLTGRDARLRSSLTDELASDGALLILCMTALTGITHAVRFLRRAEAERGLRVAAASRAATTPLTRVPVKTRGGVLLLPLEEVDWIETQGNYLALHARGKVHLLRETLARLEAGLDPRRFVRIHRRTIVRTDRVRTLTHLSNGDALVRLEDGTELRLSRNFRSSAQPLFAHATEPAGI